MKRILISLLMLIMLISIFTACGAQNPSQNVSQSASQTVSQDKTQTASQSEPQASSSNKYTAKKISEYKFTYVAPIVGNEYWAKIEQGIIDEAKKLGVNIQTTGPMQDDINTMMNMIQSAISQHVDGIISCAYNPDVSTPVFNSAVEKGIPVVLVDNDAPKSERNFFIGTSSYNAGASAAKKLIELTGGKANIAIISGSLTAANCIERMNGFKDTIASYPDMKVLTSEQGDNEVNKTVQKCQAVLQAYPEVNAFFGVCAFDALGAGKVVDEQGKAGKVRIVGFDDIPDSLQLIRKGVIDAVLVQKPYDMGVQAMDMLLKIYDGTTPKENAIDTGITIVDKSNIDQLYPANSSSTTSK